MLHPTSGIVRNHRGGRRTTNEKNQDIAEQDTVVFTPDESEEEPFNTAIDNTSDDPTIVMGKPVTTAFVSDDVRIPTEKVGCLQVTSQLIFHQSP